MKSVILISAMALLTVAGCKNVRDTELSKLTPEQSAALDKKLNGEEMRLLIAYRMRTGMSAAFGGSGAPDGMTVRQAIDEERKWAENQKVEEAKADALKQKVEAERKAKQQEFNQLLSAALVTKKNIDGEYGQRSVGLAVAFENKSDKDIQGVKGVLVLSDIFGDPIEKVRLSYDAGIDARKIATYKGGVEINRFMEKDIKLWNTDFDKLKANFETSTVIFRDGTKIEAPQD
jgi:hypothetical protein